MDMGHDVAKHLIFKAQVTRNPKFLVRLVHGQDIEEGQGLGAATWCKAVR